jgi:3-dehydroquinate dehydratase-2
MWRNPHSFWANFPSFSKPLDCCIKEVNVAEKATSEARMVSILIMNGPNLNLLGTRQPKVYGSTTLSEIKSVCEEQAASVGAEVTFFQSNHEGDLIDRIHSARGKFDGIILNAGALSHTSIAIMDAIFSVEIPTIDMHLSNIHRREEFRSVSYVAKAAIGSICGFGPGSYLLAIDAMMMHLGSAASGERAVEAKPKAEPLATTKDQMLPEEAPAPASGEASEPPKDTSAPKRDAKTETPADIAAEIAAAAASALSSEKGAEEKAEKAPEPEAKPEASKPDNKNSRTSAFNEMFDTPSKEVLDSLGIAAPELNPPGKKEEAPKTGKSPLRSFRKFS